MGAPLPVMRAPPTSFEELRDAEVEELHEQRAVVAGREEDVGRLEVAVDDAGRVRLLEAARHLVADHHAGRDVEALVALEAALEILAGEVLHDHVEADPGVGADVEHVDDVLALDLPEREGLTTEASDDELALLHRLVDQLDRDLLAEIEMDRLADDAHAADAEHATHLVLPADGESDERAVRRRHYLRRPCPCQAARANSGQPPSIASKGPRATRADLRFIREIEVPAGLQTFGCGRPKSRIIPATKSGPRARAR